MDIHSIKKIIFPAVHDVIAKLEEDQHEIKLTLLREIFNEAINGHLNINHSSNVSIKAMFSGRGRAWAKINVDDNNPAWSAVKNSLNNKMLSSTDISGMFEECSNMLDIFEGAGFAWIRFISSSKGFSKFQIRIKGSKLEDHIKVRIDNIHLLNDNVVNLEGVPHNLNLESGDFQADKLSIKEKIDIHVPEKDLMSFGIQTLEEVLSTP
jgi:hypothetical protein